VALSCAIGYGGGFVFAHPRCRPMSESTSLTLIATTAFGLEAVVVRELEALGYTETAVTAGRVRFAGDLRALVRANLWLRSADRVLLCMGTFPAADFDALFDSTRALPWADWIPLDGRFPVTGRCVRSQLSSEPACQRTVKKAVVESLRAGYREQTLPECGATYRIHVALVKDEATLTLDTSGIGLHKRGYRAEATAAPLKETLAAALVQLSFWRPDRPLLDPFCGSGTIPIEAALIARNIAPGRARAFDAERWGRIPRGLWTEERAAADDAVRPDVRPEISGSDIDSNAIGIARQNARRAGVEDIVSFATQAFDTLAPATEWGCLISNPPYGERLADADLGPLYRSMPRTLRRLSTWSHFLLTAYPDVEQVFGQDADRRRKLYNGRIQCTYYQFHGPPPGDRQDSDTASPAPAETDHSSAEVPAVRPAFGGLPEHCQAQARDFRSRLLKRARHLRRYRQRGISCYRLYERDVPGVPVVVDCYDDCLHITAYARQRDRTPAQQDEWVELMTETAAETLEVPRERTFVKQRRRQAGSMQHQRVAEAQVTREVVEDGLRFHINLSDYIDTGLFLDHRLTRQMVREQAAQKRFLNLFCYTGAFTVYAAAGGAVSTTNVDLSHTYLVWAERNLTLNDLNGPDHRFLRRDVMQFLADDTAQYDLAVVDVPTFSNSKSTDTDWDVQQDHPALLQQVFARMAPGGVVYFATNFRKFRLDDTVLESVVGREITRQTVPPEYTNRTVHRCWRFILP
jgi:23S rRNA (guanine2445-N2)-methyltransferase / 23S rRNA (guanine2069-N7)-methyltransferase